MFVDRVKIYIRSGDGGKGCVSFRRGRFRPKGGPHGGDGGNGGNVVLRAGKDLHTLLDLRYRPRNIAQRGGHGGAHYRKGKDAGHCILKVPVGTIVMDAQTGEELGDLRHDREQIVVAKGGQGGRGNAHFRSSTCQAPRYAEEGQPGEERWLQLELRLLADVGLVGLPNAGKSTLLAQVSAAQPKIAPYPFTTLTPKLGVVKLTELRSFVMADIPGLIPGAHQGKGLGHRFLRHLERTRLLVHLVDLTGEEDPLSAFESLRHELELYSPMLAAKPRLIAANKIDLPDAWNRLAAVEDYFFSLGCQVYPISAKTGQGVKDLLSVIQYHLFQRERSPEEPVAVGDADRR